MPNAKHTIQMRQLRNTPSTKAGVSDSSPALNNSSSFNSGYLARGRLNKGNENDRIAASPAKNSNKSQQIRGKSTTSGNSITAASPRRFGNSANNTGTASNSNYLANAKQRLRRSPSPPVNRNKHRQQQLQPNSVNHKQDGKSGVGISTNIPVNTNAVSKKPVPFTSPPRTKAPTSIPSLPKSKVPFTSPKRTKTPSQVSSTATSISTSSSTGSVSATKKWTPQNRATTSKSSTKLAPQQIPITSSTSSSSLSSSVHVPPEINRSIPTTKVKKTDKDSDMMMQDSGDQPHVWVRHSLLLNVLNPKPSYGNSASSSSVTNNGNSSVNTHLSTSNAPTTPLRKTPSFLKQSPFLSSTNTPNPTQKSYSLPPGGGKSLFGSSMKNSHSNDDASTSASTVSSALSNATTPAKWGWVKALMLNNDAFTTKKSNNRVSEQVPLENAKKVPAWQKQLKNKNQAPAVTPTKPTPEREMPMSAPTPTPTKVSLKIIDLESEFHGQTIDIPLSTISGNKKGNGNNSENGLQSIFGDTIVMANAWHSFTKLPERTEIIESDTINTNSLSTPKSKWSSFKEASKQEEKKPESPGMDSKIPSDLTNLSHLHEPAVVFCLRYRYAMNEIYTSTGPILLALNPFKEVKGIYSDELMRKYCDHGQGLMNGIVMKKKSTEGNEKKLPPHVYAVADNAYRAMMRALEDASGGSDEIADQSILVSGESGAGKTVTTKIIMKYLANLSKRSGAKKTEKKKAISSGWNKGLQNFASPPAGSMALSSSPASVRGRNIEQQVLESNPILESFGNARTNRNDNSSRFGKFIEIKFTSSGKLMGASVDSYLLEKVRLINQAEGERNYHIFYELLAGASSSERKELLLGRSNPHDFVMTTSDSETYKRRDGVRDDTTFGALRKAMATMGFNPSDEKEILCIVSSLLHLSNITFAEDSSGCALDSKNSSLQPALQLLGMSAGALEQGLCCVNIEAGGEKVVKKLFLDQSIKAKEALIKATYGALFTYLVQHINNCINNGITTPETEEAGGDNVGAVLPGAAAFIGVLDIFGFESFEKNSFEQLCINYCNESLQQQFNRFVFKLEQAEYERENIKWDFISFPDNQNVLDLIDKRRTGILSILDEQSFLTQCTDQSFAQLIYQNSDSGGRLSNDTSAFTANSRQMANGDFSINHYAGPVEYDTRGFLEKNKDELPKEIGDLLHSSDNAFLRQLAMFINGTPASNEISSAGRTPFKQNSLKRITVGGQFSSQLQLLRERIDETLPHYVRCLKPNDKLEPDNFDSSVIAEQLRCAGILEAVRVSRVGYPQRYAHEKFVQRYQVLAIKELDLRRKDASSNFTSPVGIGFHGGFVPKSQRPHPMRANTKPVEKTLNAEQECKIVVTALARQLVTAKESSNVLSEDVENAPPEGQSSSWVSPVKMKKTGKWPTPGSSRFSTPTTLVSKKKQDLDLMELGIQMGETKVFLRQHAFEALEIMRNRIKSEAATLLNSVFRMYLKRRRYILIRNEYRARVAQRSRMLQEGRVCNNEDFLAEAANASFEHAKQYDYSAVEQISVHREEDDRIEKEFKWVMVDNRWIKNADDEIHEEGEN